MNWGVQRGFTLIEVLVASSILVLTTGAVLRLGQVSVANHVAALERTQAYQLVQDGLEIVRQIRDTNIYDGESVTVWQSGFPAAGIAVAPQFTGNRWELVELTGDSATESIERDGVTYQRTITFASASTQYAVDGGLPLTDSFNAVITPGIDQDIPAQIVRVEVRWQSRGEDWYVSGATLLTDWRL